MDLNQVKETLEAIGYPVQSDDWNEAIEELSRNYGAQKVGSSIRTLGDASPLYLKSGNAAFMVDNQSDLHRACVEIQSVLKARTAAEPITIKRDVRSRFLSDIQNSLEYEISLAGTVKRPLGVVDADYEVLYDHDTRTQTRKSPQIIDDLLSDDKQRNAKAVEAMKAILIVGEGQ